MPSQKPRLNLTLDDELNDLITDLSRLMGIPKTRVITDLLKDVLPALKEIRDALELAKEKRRSTSFSPSCCNRQQSNWNH